MGMVAAALFPGAPCPPPAAAAAAMPGAASAVVDPSTPIAASRAPALAWVLTTSATEAAASRCRPAFRRCCGARRADDPLFLLFLLLTAHAFREAVVRRVHLSRCCERHGTTQGPRSANKVPQPFPRGQADMAIVA